MDRKIGEKIKSLRGAKNITLQNLSDETGLSVGFLSQLERGKTSSAIASLNKISEALGVDLGYFFSLPQKNHQRVNRSYERDVFHMDSSKIIYYNLTNDDECTEMTPLLVEMMPMNEEELTPYTHEGEEFIYVLEGILTIHIEGQRLELYPGDTCHFTSAVAHDWANYTTKPVKLLSIVSPQIFNLPARDRRGRVEGNNSQE